MTDCLNDLKTRKPCNSLGSLLETEIANCWEYNLFMHIKLEMERPTQCIVMKILSKCVLDRKREKATLKFRLRQSRYYYNH